MADAGDPLVLRTEIGRISLPLSLDHHTRFLTIGSCFADNIGEHLVRSKFQVTVNPSGTIYDPLSVCRILSSSIAAQPADETLFTERDGIWYSHNWHSSVHAGSREELRDRLSLVTSNIGAALARSNVLMVTLGTAFVHRHLSSGKDIANCHKLPAGNFEKRLLEVDEIVSDFTACHQELRSIRPDLRIILSVSPVRHVRDTLPLNSLSKAVLRVACDQLIRLPDVHYFPAYEIMVDDLRDYRFYADDLIHPTPLAITHIWNKFLSAAFTSEAREWEQRWEKVSRSLSHRPFHPGSEAHLGFLSTILEELMELRKVMDVEEEIRMVTRSLQS